MIDTISIGKIIQRFRVERKMTQEYLAEQIGISKNYLSKVERGLSRLNIESFLKMAEVLEFDLSDFGVDVLKTVTEEKRELIEIVLSRSVKDVEAYLKLINTFREIVKR
jgi:transcriptional regulator with XRE-family HTH domain